MVIYTLYVKTHRKTGLKYLGKTKQDPYEYLGSGKRWTRHLKKHGNDVDTQVLQRCFSNSSVKAWGLFYSKLWSVVESKKWANLRPEDGDGGDTSMCDAFKEWIKRRDITGPKNPRYGKKFDYVPRPSKQGKNPSNFDQWARAAKGKSYYNNGVAESRFLPDDVPSGWVKGRLQIQCRCGKWCDISNLKRHHKGC